MEPFVKVTYALEGDGPIALTAYEQISTLYSHISTAYYPNVNVLAPVRRNSRVLQQSS